MFLAHSFRLRDPWQCEARACGGLRWSRVFHRPTGLEEDDALWLVCSLLPAGAVVTINGQRMTPCADGESSISDPSPCATGVPPVLPPAARNEFEVTAILNETNRVEIELPFDLQPPAGPAVAAATSSLQPATPSTPQSALRNPQSPSTPFPYDVRLGVVGNS